MSNKDEINKKRISNLLKVLDFLLPILRLELGVVKFAIEKYLNEESEKVSLERFSLSVTDALEYFPTCQVAVKPLLISLSDDIPYFGLSVRLLDALSSLAIIVRGSMMEKARLIFDWFNTSHSGIMSEVELNIFLLRMTDCFLRMKLIGRIEFTQEDAQHLSFLARFTDGYGGLLPGLSFNDFYRWLSQNRLADAIITFTKVLCRLLDIVHTFENRTSAIALLIEEMQTYKQYSKPQPHFNYFGCQIHQQPVNIIFRSNRRVSLCISYPDSGARDVYIECKKICPAPSPLYKMAKKLFEAKPSDKCCDKHYFLTSYQSHALPDNWWLTKGTKSLKVNIVDLDPNSDYSFTVYTKKWKYDPIAIRTCPSSQQLTSNDQVRVCLLPASVTANEAEDLITRSSDYMNDYETIIFTGTVCPINEALKHAMEISSLPCEQEYWKYSPQQFAASISSYIDSLYCAQWMNYQNKLLNCRIISKELLHGFSAKCSEKQIITFNGIGVWSKPQWKNEVQGNMTEPMFKALSNHLESLYERYVQPMLPPSIDWHMGPLMILFLNQNHTLKMCGRHTSNRNSSAIAAIDIPPFLTELNNNPLTAEDTRHLVVVMRSPDDLFAGQTYHTSMAVQQELEEESPLTGSHEIVHGEYTSEDAAAVVAARRRREQLKLSAGKVDVFQVICSSLFEWMSSNPTGRKVTLVSVGWMNGANFALSHKGSLSIAHESLLEVTPATMQSAADNVIKKLRVSLPENVTLNEGGPSPERAMLLHESPPGGKAASKILFKPISLKVPLPLFTAPPPSIPSPSRVRVISRPKLINISSTETVIAVKCIGEGIVFCCVRQIPLHANYVDAATLTIVDLEKLTVVQTQSKLSKGLYHKRLVFTFSDLQPYSSYCAIIHTEEVVTDEDDDPNRNKNIVHFRTLCIDSASTSTFLVVPVTEFDYSLPSLVVTKTIKFLDQTRASAVPVHLLHYDAPLALPSPSTDPQQDPSLNLIKTPSIPAIPSVNFADLSSISLRACTVHSGYQRDGDSVRMSEVDFARNGRFCRMAPKSKGIQGLHALIQCLDVVDGMGDLITGLTVFVSTPLIHYLERTGDGKWDIPTDNISLRRDAIETLLLRLLRWKGGNTDRDCQIVCTVCISSIECAILKEKGCDEVLIRHLILPSAINVNPKARRICLPKPTSEHHEYSIGMNIEYALIDNPTLSSCGVTTILPNISLYDTSANDDDDDDVHKAKLKVMDPVIYAIDVVTSHLKRPGSADHNVTVRMIANDVDNLDILVGPVVGVLTADTVNILFEINRALFGVRCVLIPLGFPDEAPIEQSKTKVRAYKAFTFRMESLVRDRKYMITLPEVTGDRCLGIIKTFATYPYSMRLLFTGDKVFESLPMLQKLLDQVLQQQTPDLRLLLQDSTNQNNEDYELSIKSGEKFAQEDTWGTISKMLRRPCNDVQAVVHLGPETVITSHLKLVYDFLLKQITYFDLPIKDASPVSAFYFSQFEEIMKDTFRVLWSVPSIRESLCSASHIILFHSDYLFPPVTKSNIGTTIDIHREPTGDPERDGDEDGGNEDIKEDHEIDGEAVVSTTTAVSEGTSTGSSKNVGVVRKVFESLVQAYLGSLTDYDPDVGHHSIVWKLATCTMIIFDIVSNRRKIKKKKNAKSLESLGSDGDRTSSAKIQGFTPGFLDDGQWSLLKNLLRDPNTLQLVLCTQEPFLSLTEIPSDFTIQSPVIPKGTIIPWMPTESDLTYFFELLFKWLKSQREGLTRNLVLVSSSIIPYVTTIQDMWTGAMIQQVCVGRVRNQRDVNLSPIVNDIADKMILTGSLGNIRYSHRLTGMHDVHINCSRVRAGGGPLVPLSDIVSDHIFSPTRNGFGYLRMFFDTWKYDGTYSYDIPHEISLVKVSTGIDMIVPGSTTSFAPTDSIMLLGPVIGAPVLINSPKYAKAIRVPMMIEVDHATTLFVSATNMVGGEIITWTFHTASNLPTILDLAPLEVGTIYHIQILSGIMNFMDFDMKLVTFIHTEEVNVVVLNDRAIPLSPPCSEFIQNLDSRCRIPFNGLNVILHMNLDFNFQEIFEDFLLRIPHSKEILVQCYTEKLVPYRMRTYLLELLERLRDVFRDYFTRPSHRELFKHSFHLFMLKMIRASSSSFDITEEERKVTLIPRLFELVLNRVKQEYIYQLQRSSRENPIFFAQKRIERKHSIMSTDSKISNSNNKYDYRRRRSSINALRKLLPDNSSVKDKKEKIVDPLYQIIISDVTLNALDAVLEQWMHDLEPADIVWSPWEAPNGNLFIEQICAATVANGDELCREIDNDDSGRGIRLIVMEGSDDNEGGADDLFDAESQLGLKFQKAYTKWSNKRYDRGALVVCPSTKDGTVMKLLRRMLDGNSIGIQMVDSCYRSLAHEMNAGNPNNKQEIGDKTAQIIKSALSKNRKASSPAVVKKLGYLIIECRTLPVKLPDSEHYYSFVTPRIVSALAPGEKEESYNYSDLEADRPSFLDFIQLPSWWLQFLPSSPAVFVRDEVMLNLHQHPESRKIVDRIESDDMFADILEAYEQSKLSDLARPAELREVDVEAPGIIPLYLKDLCEHIWNNCLTETFRSRMVFISDEVFLSYILAFLQPTRLTFSSSIDFATFMQSVLILSTALYFASEMSTNPKWRNIVELPEFPIMKELQDESDLELDESDIISNDDDEEEELDEKGKPKKKVPPPIVASVKEAPKPTKDKKGKVEESKVTLEMFFAAKAEMVKLSRQRILRRRSYGEKIKYFY